MKLVWLTEDLQEREWIEFLLDGVVISRQETLAWPRPEPDTIYAFGCNSLKLSSAPKEFWDELRRVPGVGLIHLSDEWYGGGYEYYKYFDFVIRTHHAKRLTSEYIYTIPLGYPLGGTGPERFTESSTRTHTWSFFGNPIASRATMLRELSPVAGLSSSILRLERPEYRRILADTVFAPCPMGNVMAETWRLYEALEYGCIPIVERRWALDYYRDLFGQHPIPTFKSWRSAASFISDLASSEHELNGLQAEIGAWWTRVKSDHQVGIKDFISSRINRRLRKKDTFIPPNTLGPLWQYQQLLKHQTTDTTLRLLTKVIRRRSIRMP